MFFYRYTIFSPKDGQPRMDHDRQTGEVRETRLFLFRTLSISMNSMCVHVLIYLGESHAYFCDAVVLI